MTSVSAMRASLKRRLSPAAKRTGMDVNAAVDKLDATSLRQALALDRSIRAASPARHSGSPARKSPSRKSPARKSPAKKSPARKSPKKGRKGKKATPTKARSRTPSPRKSPRSPARSPSKMTVKQIQGELKKLGLHYNGKREVILARLNEAHKGQIPATQATNALKHKALGCPKKKNSPSTCITPKVKAAKAKRERGDSKEQLVKLCKQAGLKTTGTKEQLKARLANPSVNDHKKVKKAVNKVVKPKAKSASPKKASPKKSPAKKGRGRPKKA